MKTTKSLFLLLLLITYGVDALAQVSMRANDISNNSAKQFFYHWDGFEIQWYGPEIAYVEGGDLSGFSASGRTFSQAYSENSFAYTMMAVSDWDTNMAAVAVGVSPGVPPESSPFVAYLNSLTAGTVNRHGGNQYGFGVDNGDPRVSPEAREDKIDVPGEALVIQFDLQGEEIIGGIPGTFGPESSAFFQNTGLNEHARLVLKELVIRPWAASVSGEIDYIFYDMSEGTYLQDSLGVSAFGEYIDMRQKGSVLTGPWNIEHGDILIIAHPTNPANNLDLISSELWSMTFDLEFDAPTPAPLDVPSDPAEFPQHQYAPGFSNTWRTDGELLALYRTDPVDSAIRTVVMDFHRGHLLTENRGISGGGRIFYDLTDVTSETPSEPVPENRTLDEVFRANAGGAMHTAYSLLPDYRVNHPGDSYVDLAGLSNSTPSIADVGRPPGFSGADGGARSAYILPYHYDSEGNGKKIRDARTGQTLSVLDDHGFGSGSLPVPIGNILLLAKIRAGERAIASYDVSDPSNPVLLDVMRDEDPRWRHQEGGAYEPAVYNNFFIVPLSLRGGTIGFVDYSDPGNLRMHHIISGTKGAQRYIQFQDHRMFAGTEVIDLTHLDGGITPTEHEFPGHKGEYMLPLGNIVVCAENSEQGAENLGAIYAFQAEPDVLPPSVTYHVPAAGATDQLVTSRIGLVIHETLDATTIDETTFRVFPVSDSTETSIPGTRVLSDKDILTFTPSSPLQSETTYRVVIEGVADIVSNPMERYTFDFTTAGPNSVFYPTINQATITTEELIVDSPIQFSMEATPDGGQSPSTLEYRWEFGDGTATDWSNANQTVAHTYQYDGQFAVRALVRSVNAPDRVAMRYLQPSVFFKPAGEDGFEPRFEAENGNLTGSNSQILTSADSSGGKHFVGGPNSGLYWDFDTVGGAFDFQFRISVPSGASIPGNQSFAWRVRAYVSEIVDGVVGPEVVLGEVGTRSYTYELKSVSAYLSREGRYRLRIGRGTGPRDPRVDYVDVLQGMTPVRYEADSGSITNGTIVTDAVGSPWENATDGSYVAGSEGFEIQWDFDAYQAGTYDLALRASSQTPGSSQMGLFVNGVKVQVVTVTTGSFELVPVSVDLLAGANTIELRDSEGSTEFNIDYLDITIPEYVKPVILLPIKSSQIAHDTTRRLIITVNPDNDTVTAIDANTLAVAWEREVLGNPRSVAIDANGLIWITCHDDDTIYVLDPDNPANDVELVLPYGSAPHDILFNHAGTRAFVSQYGTGQVFQINATDFTLVNTIDSLTYPTALAMRADGSELLVNRFISPASSGIVYSISIDPETDAMVLQTPILLQPDTDSEDGPNTGRGVPNYLSGITINPTDSTAYVASQKVNTLAGLFREGTSLNHDSTVRSIVSQIDLVTGLENFTSRFDMDDSSQPTSLHFTERGDYLFVTIQGNNAVFVLNPETGVRSAELPVGLAPQGVYFDEETKKLFVKNFMSRSVTVHDLSGALSSGDFNNTNPQNIVTVTNEVLSTEVNNNVLLGKQVFYNAADVRMSFQSYLSCASCHQGGGHDGVTWDFTQRGEGLRNTTDLRGRSGMGHGNVHWSGNFDEIQDFELDIRNQFGGTGFIVGNVDNNPLAAQSNAGRSVELDALAAYVSSLNRDSLPKSPNKDIDGSLTTAAQNGKTLFEMMSCVSCHVPSTGYTDSTWGVRHDVGTIKIPSSGTRLGQTLDGIDTPTLLGVHATAPYFHDGSVQTLEELFDPAAHSRTNEVGKAHDLTGTYGLSAQQVSDLIAYVNELDYGDLTPPSAPGNVTVMAGDGQVSLDWDDGGGDVSSYAVYRSESPNDPGATALAVNLTTSAYVDQTVVNGTTYYYTIVAIDLAGNASTLSAEVSETPVASATPAGPLVGYWKFEDGAGTTVTDSSGNENHATASNPVWVTGQEGGALDFNGSNSMVAIPVTAFNGIVNEVSISMWVYGDTTQARNDTVFRAVDASGNRVLNIHLPWGNRNVYWDAGNNGGNYDRMSKQALDSDYKGQWNHWAFTKNAVTGEMKIYLNGTLWHSSTGKSRSLSTITSAALGSAIGGGHYDGMIDEVRVYNKALTEAEVEDVYQSADSLKLAQGVITDVDSNWLTLILPEYYNSMVVVATPVLNSNTDTPVVTRVRNASGNSFELKVQNPAGSPVSGVSVHYMVVEEGVYTQAEDGFDMEALKVVSTGTNYKNTWNSSQKEQLTTANTYASPVVLGQVMTENDLNWSTFWASNGSAGAPPSSSAIYVGKHVAEDPNTVRADETLGVIILNEGPGALDGVNFVAGVGADSIRGTGNGSSFSYTLSGLSSVSSAVTSSAAMDGADGGWPVLATSVPLSPTSLLLLIDEDQLSDSERSHTTEQVSYLVFE
ncbi:MAG: LamG-like jellyroll fold domain-containing protein [Verrucomicrobiota bacterium]